MSDQDRIPPGQRFDRDSQSGNKNNLSNSAQMKNAINSLVDQPKERTRFLKPLGGNVPKTSQTGTGKKSSAAGSGGIASPLTEQDATTRTYHSPRFIHSFDGIIFVEIKPIHTINMKDAGSNNVQLIFADPPII